MPATSIINGQTIWVPQVEVATKVVQDGAGEAPGFTHGVILGEAFEGHPFGASASQYDDEVELRDHLLQQTSTATADYYGYGSGLHVAMLYAKKCGLPRAHVAAVNALTRANIVAQSTSGPTDELNIFPRKWGAPAGWTKIKFASNVLTITPVKHFALLSANASTSSKRIYLKGYKPHEWVRVGQTLSIGHNTATEVETLVVAAKGAYLDANKQWVYWIDFTAAPSAAYATATYAMIVEYDTVEEVSTSLTTGQAVNDWLNNYSAVLASSPHDDFTNAALIAVSSATRLIDLAATWGTATAGTSPVQAASNYSAYTTAMLAGGYDTFVEQEQILPRIYLAVTGDATSHANLLVLAQELRIIGRPIQIYTGARYTDVSLTAGDATDLTYRARTLNSQEVYLAAGQVDRLDPYLSFAPQCFGYKVAGGVGENLTQNVLFYEHIGVRWDEINSGQLTSLHRQGVITYRLAYYNTSPRYVISQDINTLQNRAVVANESDSTSGYGVWRLRQDYHDYVIAFLITTSQLGANSVDRDSFASMLLTRANRILAPHIRSGTKVTINSIAANASGTGWVASVNTEQPPIADFFSVTVNARVGGP